MRSKRTFVGLLFFLILLNSYFYKPDFMTKGIEQFFYSIAGGIGASIIGFILGYGISFLIPKKYRPSKLDQMNLALICSLIITVVLKLHK